MNLMKLFALAFKRPVRVLLKLSDCCGSLLIAVFVFVAYCTAQAHPIAQAKLCWIAMIVWLFMRKAGDRRDDSVIKKEMLVQLRIAGFNPVMVFEDRDRVVKMWRENGVRCMQVANGDF